MGLNDVVRSKKDEILQIATRYGAIRIRMFGSVARGEEGENSDLDLLVKFESGRSLLDLIGLKQDLEELLGRKVDVVSEGGVSPYLRDRIFQEAIPL